MCLRVELGAGREIEKGAGGGVATILVLMRYPTRTYEVPYGGEQGAELLRFFCLTLLRNDPIMCSTQDAYIEQWRKIETSCRRVAAGRGSSASSASSASSGCYDFLINLSADDYPIKSVP